MINSEGFIDWATRIDGIRDKVYSARNTGSWITCHSIVGEEADFEDGIPNRFLAVDQYYDPALGQWRYTAAAAASCMFVLRKSGELIQMHPVWASTWTSGGPEANCNSWAIEAEGGLNPFTEPLTRAAEDTFIRLVREWEGYANKRAEPGVTLLQHKDVAARYGYAATACASDRYANAWARVAAGDEVEEEASMTAEEIKAIAAEAAEAFVTSTFRTYLNLAVNGGQGAFTDKDGNPLPLIRDTRLVADVDGIRQVVQGHVVNHARQPGANGVPEHTHTPGGVA